ncbi:hypothetical protein LIS77_23170 [Cytobacillus firmus]|uniref:hypothetical protein n=1 Tax=Cytobacillus firmus TaxID=1399 RepID=UPI00207A984D|nr:hypothetical protein [Cytobacillus firmus]USK38748.1 hypothetical protein LIS77_23170 [Cytobacillus firmus]
MNITNRNGKPANRDAYFANRPVELQIAWPILQIVIEILQIEQFRKADAADFKRKFTFKNSSFGVLNITNRNGKPANRDAYFANRRLNLQIAWPILQIVIEILQIGQACTADATRF